MNYKKWLKENQTLAILAIAFFGCIAACFIMFAVGGLFYLFREPAEASGPLGVIPIETVIVIPTSILPQDTPGGDGTAPLEPTQPEFGSGIFRIVQNESLVRFTVSEYVGNAPKDAVGESNQVSGEILIDLVTPGNTQIGTILINARTIMSSNESRNKIMHNEILETDTYEFITFKPTAIVNIPASLAIGQTLNLQIIGELTIKNVTQPVTFDLEITLESATRLVGHASTVILRSQFGVVIPDVPNVTSVDDDVRLEIFFVAAP